MCLNIRIACVTRMMILSVVAMWVRCGCRRGIADIQQAGIYSR